MPDLNEQAVRAALKRVVGYLDPGVAKTVNDNDRNFVLGRTWDDLSELFADAYENAIWEEDEEEFDD